jgi:DNA ligase-1
MVEKKRPQGLSAFLGGNESESLLSIIEVQDRFAAMARTSGKRSQDIKIKNLQFLFGHARPLEARYIARLAIEDMRIGVGEGSIRDAVARAFAAAGADSEKVERAYNLTNDMGLVAAAARAGTLDRLSVMINHPIKMMLATLGESIPAALAEIGTAAVEWKYDGARVQIHKDGDRVRVFSRRLENVTASLPEIVEAARQVKARSAILDGEAVAMGGDGRPRAFQEILKRFRRKYHVAKLAKEIPLRLFLFDLIYLDGESLAHLPLKERRAILEGVAEADLLADQMLSDNPAEVEAAYDMALKAGHEGLILKNPSSAYAPGKRGKNWLKIKPVMETLDLVVIGAKWGEGRRASFLGSYRLACVDQSSGKLLDVGWVATGLTDEALAELTEMFRELFILEKGMEVEIKPAVIFEVAYEEIQKSPNYSSGYALRFPRMVRVRDDKSLEEADTLERILSLYRSQRGRNTSL